MDFDKNKYKIWDWKSPVILHWIINPIMVINDLVLGQTIPKIMLIEREGYNPFYVRSLIPCPHCNTLHNGLKWSSINKTAYKNWYGYYCDNCQKIIPVHRNIITFIILFLTFPVWIWFKKKLKQNWLNRQPERFKTIIYEIPANKNSLLHWLKLGLYFGIIIYFPMTFILSIIEQKEITLRSQLIDLPFWLCFGLIYGLLMKFFINKKGRINIEKK